MGDVEWVMLQPVLMTRAVKMNRIARDDTRVVCKTMCADCRKQFCSDHHGKHHGSAGGKRTDRPWIASEGAARSVTYVSLDRLYEAFER